MAVTELKTQSDIENLMQRGLHLTACKMLLKQVREKEAEIAVLKTQLHTEHEQRQFVSALVENQPHAQILGELEQAKAGWLAARADAAALRETLQLVLNVLDADGTLPGTTAKVEAVLAMPNPGAPLLEELARLRAGVEKLASRIRADADERGDHVDFAAWEVKAIAADLRKLIVLNQEGPK